MAAGIHGVGGMGKTALAQAFAYQEADAFPGGCWLLRCEGRERLLTVFRTLVTELEIELTDEEKLDDARAVRRVFDVLRARGPALFVLDNVDHPALLAQESKRFPVERACNLMVEARIHWSDNSRRVQVEVRSEIIWEYEID
jgi:NB-ARC domain